MKRTSRELQEQNSRYLTFGAKALSGACLSYYLFVKLKFCIIPETVKLPFSGLVQEFLLELARGVDVPEEEGGEIQATPGLIPPISLVIRVCHHFNFLTVLYLIYWTIEELMVI